MVSNGTNKAQTTLGTIQEHTASHGEKLLRAPVF